MGQHCDNTHPGRPTSPPTSQLESSKQSTHNCSRLNVYLLSSLHLSAFLRQQLMYKQVDIGSRMSTGSLVSDIIISCFFFFLTMYGSIMGGSGQIKVTQNGDVNKAIGVAPEQAPPTNKENTTQENELKSAQMIEHEQ